MLIPIRHFRHLLIFSRKNGVFFPLYTDRGKLKLYYQQNFEFSSQESRNKGIFKFNSYSTLII